MPAGAFARVSRGCLPCRTRRVKCDQSRPSCKGCLRRDEVCEGYRDDATLLFRSENEKVARRVLADGRKRRSSVGSSSSQLTASSSNATSASSLSLNKAGNVGEVAELSPKDIAGVNLTSPYPWTKSVPTEMLPSAEDQAVSQFFEKFVMYPCNNGSSPGFLEHLPSLFKDNHTEGRIALRSAVRAAAYASLANEPTNSTVGTKALKCYGSALTSLSDALGETQKEPDDYILMTIVVLDLFESIYLKDRASLGSHTGGMAGILRLRGPNQMYSSRGWSLFRLAYHRLQKAQLAFGQPPLPESDAWLDTLDDELSDIRIEKHNHHISKTCEKARSLLRSINDDENSVDRILEMITEMHKVDQVSTTWRTGPGWSFQTLHRSELLNNDDSFPEFIQLHPDVWIAYEWNYYRTGRIILHRNLLTCLDRLESLSSGHGYMLQTILGYRERSISIIRSLINEVLATVPQSLGDIDNEGRKLDTKRGLTMCKGIGGYFLLWPIRVLKGTPFTTEEQASLTNKVFERIRECTGMKTALGDASIVEGI